MVAEGPGDTSQLERKAKVGQDKSAGGAALSAPPLQTPMLAPLTHSASELA